ncbi:MAG: RNA-binding domain-containing protein [Anaerolineales bacterium]|jgi:hypothetical protein
MRAVSSGKLVITRSVFVFLRSVFFIEFFFSFLPLLLSFLFNAQQEYETTTFAVLLPYPLLSLIIVTLLQILALTAAFAFWYFPGYEIWPDRIIHRRSNLFEDHKMADVADILRIRIRQGWLARRMNYGTLQLELQGKRRAFLRDIPGPQEIMEVLEAYMAASRAQYLLPDATSAMGLIEAGENQFVEFKSSLVWDYYQTRANKNLNEPVMKTLAAFMNTRGGTLLIGVNDDGEILGLEPDFGTFRKKDVDGFELAFNAAFNSMLGVQNRQYVEVTFPKLDEKIICVAQASPARGPVFLAHQGQETFYVRAGNATQAMMVRQAAEYIRSHFAE